MRFSIESIKPIKVAFLSAPKNYPNLKFQLKFKLQFYLFRMCIVMGWGFDIVVPYFVHKLEKAKQGRKDVHQILVLMV